MTTDTFTTHTGEVITGQRLAQALNAVADWKVKNAHGIYNEDFYASHVSKKTKLNNRERDLECAERIRNGTEPMGFWLWQRINNELTGECIAFLPKTA